MQMSRLIKEGGETWGGGGEGGGVGIEERRAKQGRVKAWQREGEEQKEGGRKERHAWKVIKRAWLAGNEDRDVLLAPWHSI